jgi:predicted Zn finger-like uncharacterized protein
MILSCPACATSYFVDDAKIGSVGRTVRCASCGERWHASLPQEGEAADSTPKSPITPEQRAKSAAARRAQQSAQMDIGGAPEPTPKATPKATATAEETPLIFASVPTSGKKAGFKISPMVITAVMAVGLVGLIAAGLVLRADVMRLWPKSASAYALVGLAANPTGLSIEGIKTDRVLKDGHAGLAVSGSIRNVSHRALIAPPLRITLTDPKGKTLLVQIAKPDGVSLPVGAVRFFSITIIDPPALARDMDVDFVLDKPVQTAPAPHAPAIEPDHGPMKEGAVDEGAAKEVKPLPANSPYALPQEAGMGDADHADKKAPTLKGHIEKPSPVKPVAHGHG